jgi:hypothetical protein
LFHPDGMVDMATTDLSRSRNFSGRSGRTI